MEAKSLQNFGGKISYKITNWMAENETQI